MQIQRLGNTLIPYLILGVSVSISQQGLPILNNYRVLKHVKFAACSKCRPSRPHGVRPNIPVKKDLETCSLGQRNWVGPTRAGAENWKNRKLSLTRNFSILPVLSVTVLPSVQDSCSHYIKLQVRHQIKWTHFLNVPQNKYNYLISSHNDKASVILLT